VLPAALAALVNCAPVDELSAREIEVLEALRRPGSLRQVADDLYISRNTIKTHTRALYTKLGVASRADAVRRGTELGLLDRRTRTLEIRR
jgi:LuxR family maltose regulon positive regulatory protein